MIVFTAGNVLATVAPTYSILLLSRVITAVSHGVFFAVAATVAADMVPANKKALPFPLCSLG